MRVHLGFNSTAAQCYGDESLVWIMELEVALAAWCSKIERHSYSADLTTAFQTYWVEIDTDREYSALCASLMQHGYDFAHWRKPATV